MRLFGIAMLAVGSLVISGCFFPPILDGVGRTPKYQGPVGAHFVKPDMTREERLRDWSACGAGDVVAFCQGLEGEAFAACKGRCKLNFCFTKEEKEQAAPRPGELTKGYSILIGKVGACMESKGYQRLPLGECSSNQEYQPRCLWP